MKNIFVKNYTKTVEAKAGKHIERFKLASRIKGTPSNIHLMLATIDIITASLVYEDRIQYLLDGQLPIYDEILVTHDEVIPKESLKKIYSNYFKTHLADGFKHDLKKEITTCLSAVSEDVIELSIRTLINSYNDFKSLKAILDQEPVEFFCLLGTFFEISKNNERGLVKSACPIKSRGMVFTPYDIAQFITKRVVDSVDLETQNIKTLDPSCGAGIFVLTSLNELSKKNRFGSMKKISKNLFAADIDNDSCLVTRLLTAGFIYFKEDEVVDIGDNIMNGSSISRSYLIKHEKSFDIVVGNPPYLKMTRNEAEECRSIFSDLRGELNYYKIFWLAGEHLLKPNGILGFITPSDFLSEQQSIELRRKLFVENRLLFLYDLPLKFFPGVSLEPAIAIVKKQTPSVNCKFTYVYEKNSSATTAALEKIKTKIVYTSLIDTDSFSLAETFRKLPRSKKGWMKIKLSEVLDIKFGYHPGSGDKYNQSSKNSLVAIEGRDVGQFKLNFKNKYISKNQLSEKEIKLYQTNKLVIQRIRTRKIGDDAIWIKAAYDDKGSVNLASTNGAYLKTDKHDLLVLLAILNSQEFNDRFKRTTNNVNITASDLGEMEIYYPVDRRTEQNISKNISLYIETNDEVYLKRAQQYISEVHDGIREVA